MSLRQVIKHVAQLESASVVNVIPQHSTCQSHALLVSRHHPLLRPHPPPCASTAELLSKFREKKIDFAAHSNTEDGGAVFLNLLGNLAFPLLLVGGLFLLSRRSGGAGGMGGPGGNNPLAFGAFKAVAGGRADVGVEM